MPGLIVVTGPPGSGKSAVSRSLANLFEPSALLLGDDFFAMIHRGYVAPWMPEAHRQNEVVVGAAGAAAGRLAAGGYTVVCDGVIGPWFLDEFGAATGLSELHYLVLLPPEEVCLHRVQSRTGHGFSDLEASRHMYREFAEGSADAKHVLSDIAPPETLASRVRERVCDGSLIWPIAGPCQAMS